MNAARVWAALGMGLLACGDGAPAGTGLGSAVRPAPVLVELAPDAVALGERVTVLGSGFPVRESLALAVRGVFTDERGEEHAHEGAFALEVESAGVASFVLERIPFSALQDRVGHFRGEAWLVTEPGEPPATPRPVSLRILPSIVIERLRPVDSSCPAVVPGTNPGRDLELTLRAIGVPAARQWRFTVAFASPELAVRYLRDDLARDAPWPPVGPGDLAEAPPGQHRLSFSLAGEPVLAIDPTKKRQSVGIEPPLRFGQQTHDTVLLERFATGPVAGPGGGQLTLVVSARPSTGEELRRIVRLEVEHALTTGDYDGNATLVARYPAQQVSACFAGGDIGRDLMYSEGQSETRSRSLDLRWDAQLAESLGLSVGVTAGTIGNNLNAGVNTSTSWSRTFAVSAAETSSQEAHRSLNLSAHLLPGYFGVCYRQTEKYERVVDVFHSSACGLRGLVGQAVLTDWSWGFDIATGPACPPATNLPPALEGPR